MTGHELRAIRQPGITPSRKEETMTDTIKVGDTVTAIDDGWVAVVVEIDDRDETAVVWTPEGGRSSWILARRLRSATEDEIRRFDLGA